MAEKSDSSASPLPPAPLLPNLSTENETALPIMGYWLAIPDIATAKVVRTF